MRLNKFIASATGMSRRAADEVTRQGRTEVNGQPAQTGQEVPADAVVTLDGKHLQLPGQNTTIMLNKPAGVVVSRNGQGSKTIYDLLPPELRHLKPVGRLDKDSSGLLLLTNDGELANKLTHPRYQKEKVYEVELDKPLTPADRLKIERGIQIDDYISRLHLSKNKNDKSKTENRSWRVAMIMGRNRQIRRTFAALGYKIEKLHRTILGTYKLDGLREGAYCQKLY